jgi:hypothetical protein
MEIPAYISVDQTNPASVKLQVLDPEDRTQRTMWGA